MKKWVKPLFLVTHEPDIAEYTKRVVKFKDGKIVLDEPKERWTCPSNKKKHKFFTLALVGLENSVSVIFYFPYG